MPGQEAQAPKNQPAPDADPEQLDTFSKYAPMETTLGERWHAFYDLRGVKYYYNFETQESMRRPQDEKLLPEGTEDTGQLKATGVVVSVNAPSRRKAREQDCESSFWHDADVLGFHFKDLKCNAGLWRMVLGGKGWRCGGEGLEEHTS